VTTRPGRTGLGLAVVYAAVAEHAGTIAIDSEPGRGTVVTVELPLHRQAA
jgi:two-component system sensor histidine kinase HydH